MPALAWAWLICKDGRFSGPKIVDKVQVHFLFAQKNFPFLPKTDKLNA